MQRKMGRRQFLKGAALVPSVAVAACATRSANSPRNSFASGSFFFTSQGKTAMMNTDGGGLRYFEFDVPDQVTWQPGAFFPDGHRLLFLSMEARRDGPGKPFDEYYHTTPTHIWIHDLDDGSLTEIATEDRLAPFYTPQLLLEDGRMLVQVVRNKVAQSFNMNLDGTDAQPFTKPGEGMPYGMNLSPDGQRVAYHLASPRGYEIRTCDTFGGSRTLIAKRLGHLYFGPQWSPDGNWIIFQDCLSGKDPGHDWADLFLSRADGKKQRMLTEGQALWFGTSYGSPGNYGRGSNTPQWASDGTILCSRRLPNSKVAWEYQRQRPDVDHFNREYKPELARGGTGICRINPRNGSFVRVTQSDPAVWDFRQSESPDGTQILFCRAETGGVSGIWVMDSDGRNARLLTTGVDGRGADHPRWVG